MEPQFQYDQHTATGTTAWPAPAPDISKSIIIEIADAIGALSDRISDLGVRLAPVMKPEYDQAGPDAQPAPVQSDVRNMLDALREQSNRIGRLLDRLEV